AIQELNFEDLKRTDASNTDGQSEEQHDGETVSEEMESNNQDSTSEGGAYLEMELHEGENSDVMSDNDTAREGDSSDDMTDMQTKKGKGSTDNVEDDEGGSVGQNQVFALKGINENVEIKWNVPEIESHYVSDYHNVESEVQFETKRSEERRVGKECRSRRWP